MGDAVWEVYKIFEISRNGVGGAEWEVPMSIYLHLTFRTKLTKKQQQKNKIKRSPDTNILEVPGSIK